MGEVVNLRSARKRAARVEKERIAAQNRALHGRSKAEREIEDAERQRSALRLEAHRRNDPDETT